MTAPNATLSNGRYELPPHARGVLVLADPPKAGWRLQPTANEPASVDCKPFSAREASGGSARTSYTRRRRSARWPRTLEMRNTDALGTVQRADSAFFEALVDAD